VTMVENSYWLGVIIAGVVILISIEVYNMTRDSYNRKTGEGFKKANPLMLLLLVFSFGSWYTIAILVIYIIARFLIWFLVWLIKSIFMDFNF